MAATAARALASETSLLRFELGAPQEIDEGEARQQGLTIVDLSDGFVPGVLADEPELGSLGYPPYGDVYRALANERFLNVPDAARAQSERYLELYGIFPSFGVLRTRMADDTRHACHAQLDLAPLRDFTGRLALATVGKVSAAYASRRRAAIELLQAILTCEQLLAPRHRQGVFDYATQLALQAFERRNMIVGVIGVDDSTREALLTPSLTRDFRAVLRALRERVAAATGLIEDGSAAGEQALVAGQRLDTPALRLASQQGPLPDGAPDLIGRATDVAAQALGWTSPEATRDRLRALGSESLAALHVALQLPAPPDYHSAHMELRAEIDRGDVWYEYPYGPAGARRAQPVERRPTLVLYARGPERELALMRWNTTIGGFQPEQLDDGRVVLRYKESEPGARVWREVLASPTWLPPESTPDADLVQAVGDGRYALKREALGPGFASAYGLVMMRHELVWFQRGDAQPRYQDRGVRTHGSVSYRSILRGQSHGCHRLFNHLALRLAAFLIAHRTHVHLGMLPVAYARSVRYHNVREQLSITTRGYGYELTPPLPIEVLPGRIRGRRKQPLLGNFPLPPGFRL